MANHTANQDTRGIVRQTPATGSRTQPADRPGSSLDPQLQRRVVIENVRPQVDAGRFPIKRVPGERVVVTADIFVDGHDMLAAALLYRKDGDAAWREVPMAPTNNDRWQASFTIDSIGRFEYTIEG